MPGLFGVRAADPRLEPEEVRRLGRRMATAMRTTPWLNVEVWSDDSFFGGRVHLGVANPSPQPLRNGVLRLWCDGRLFPPEGPPRTGDDGDAQLLAALFADAPSLATIDGAFALARWDPEERELTLANDRLGFRPLYWTSTDRWFAYASEVKALLAILDRLPEVDELAFRQFLAFGHMVGERTWWEGIRLLPPANRWRIGPDGEKRKNYWSFRDLARRRVEPDEAIEVLASRWEAGVGRRLRPEPVPLLLSGGLDSRLLLAELRRQGAAVHPITFGSDGCPDVRLARRSAAIAGVPHRTVSLDRWSWWRGREEALWQVDGLVSCLHLHVATVRNELRAVGALTYKHASGDTLFGGSKLRGEWRSRRPDLRERLRAMYHQNPLVGEAEAVDASAEDCAGSTEGPSLDCFTMRQRQRRMTLTGLLCLSAYCEVENPGVDLPVLELLLGGLDDTERFDNEFHRRFLLARHPRYFRNLPWQKHGRGLNESLPVRAIRGLRGRAMRRLGLRANRYAGPFFDYSRAVKESRMADRLAHQAPYADELTDGRAGRALRGGDLPYRTVLAILTVELYLRQANGDPGLAPGSLFPVRS